MKKALILNRISETSYLINKMDLLNEEKYVLFSTNAAIDVYLRERYKLECNCLSKYINPEQASKNIQIGDHCANELVDHLDELYSKEVNDTAGLKDIRFFRALYSHAAYFRSVMYLSLLNSIEFLIDQSGIEELIFFNKKVDYLVDTPTMLNDILSFLKNIKLNPIAFKESQDSKNAFRMMQRIGKLIKYPQLFLKYFSALIKRNLLFRRTVFYENSPTVLLSEILGDFSFLTENTTGFNVFYYKRFDSLLPNGIKKPTFQFPHVKIEPQDCVQKHKGIGDKYTFIKNLVTNDILSDFNKKINFYLPYLVTLDSLHKKYRIKAGTWGIPPIMGFRSLVFEFLLSSKVPALGYQHGGFLGNIYNNDFFMMCANRCTHYISYGFSNDDLKKIYPEKNFTDIEILGYGTTRTIKSDKKKKGLIDILFPVTDTASMLESGMIRDKPDTLLEKQIALLRFLDTIQGKSIVVKPFQYPTEDSLAISQLLKRTKRIKVISDLSLEECLEIFEVKIVLIEHLSTPLYEVLPFDIEIFAVGDNNIRPLEKTALEQLKKRVHFSYEVKEVISMLELFLRGKLEKKRDDTFYRHYVYKDGTKDRVMRLINELSTK